MRALRERISTPQQYYRLTGTSFRALCPEKSGHMNMGLWPAPTLRAAQEQLIATAFRAARDLCTRWGIAAPRGVMDLGSGWGGTGREWAGAFPGTPYVGINASAEQVAMARASARTWSSHESGDQDIRYVVACAEDDGLPWEEVELVMSIEAMFHFVDKARLLAAMTRHVRGAVLLEICVEDPRLIEDARLTPSLQAAWSTAQYERAFAQSGWSNVRFEDIGSRVFDGFLESLSSIDEASYGGRRAILRQLTGASAALAKAHARGDLRYVLVVADK